MIISDLDHMSAVSDADLLSGGFKKFKRRKKRDFKKDCCKGRERKKFKKSFKKFR